MIAIEERLGAKERTAISAEAAHPMALFLYSNIIIIILLILVIYILKSRVADTYQTKTYKQLVIFFISLSTLWIRFEFKLQAAASYVPRGGFSLLFGEDFQFDYYFSGGLIQPPTRNKKNHIHQCINSIPFGPLWGRSTRNRSSTPVPVVVNAAEPPSVSTPTPRRQRGFFPADFPQWLLQPISFDVMKIDVTL